MNLFLKLLLTFVLTGLPQTSLFAQERGRLPDGRAFRIDAQGNQLVDYIAELELGIESLTRQVTGLEQEVEQKNIEIERLAKVNKHAKNYRSNSLLYQDDLRERDLIARSDRTFSLTSEEKGFATCPETTCPETTCPLQECPQEEWLAEKRQLHNTLASLQEELKRVSIEDAPSQLAALREQLEKSQTHSAFLQNELDKASLEDAPSQLAALREQLKRSEAHSASLLTRLEKSGQETQSLRQELVRRESEVSEIKVALASARASLERTNAIIKAPKQISQDEPVRAAGQNRETTLSPQRLALESRKESLIKETDQIKSLIKRRDLMFQTYRASGAPVGFNPSSPVSLRNSTLEQLISRTERANQINHLYPLAQEIREIRQRVQDDIALIERMGRLSQP